MMPEADDDEHELAHADRGSRRGGPRRRGPRASAAARPARPGTSRIGMRAMNRPVMNSPTLVLLARRREDVRGEEARVRQQLGEHRSEQEQRQRARQLRVGRFGPGRRAGRAARGARCAIAPNGGSTSASPYSHGVPTPAANSATQNDEPDDPFASRASSRTARSGRCPTACRVSCAPGSTRRAPISSATSSRLSPWKRFVDEALARR